MDMKKSVCEKFFVSESWQKRQAFVAFGRLQFLSCSGQQKSRYYAEHREKIIR